MSTAPSCPTCSGPTRVTSSRKAVTHTNTMRRRRICEDCGHAFSTLETPEETVLAESFIIEWEQPVDDGSGTFPCSITITDMVDDVAKIGPRLEHLTGRRHHPATIHHWRLHRAINGTKVEWRKEKVFPWP